jgi:hypothetical protein
MYWAFTFSEFWLSQNKGLEVEVFDLKREMERERREGAERERERERERDRERQCQQCRSKDVHMRQLSSQLKSYIYTNVFSYMYKCALLYARMRTCVSCPVNSKVICI